MAGPYYQNSKVDDVDYIEAADLEAIEAGFVSVDADKAERAVPADAGDFATLTAAGNLADSGKTPPSGEVVGTTDTQTLTSKTLTTPTINGVSMSGTLSAPSGTWTVGAGVTLSGTVNLTGTWQRSGTTITATAADLNKLAAVTATFAELNILDGATLTTAELNYLDGVTSAVQTQLNAKAAASTAVTLTGAQTLTDKTLTAPVLTAPREVFGSTSGAQLDLATGSYFRYTATGGATLSLTNVPAGAFCFILEIINGGGYLINLWSSISWPLGDPPELTTTGRDVFGFYTLDGGSTWSGFFSGKSMS